MVVVLVTVVVALVVVVVVVGCCLVDEVVTKTQIFYPIMHNDAQKCTCTLLTVRLQIFNDI